MGRRRSGAGSGALITRIRRATLILAMTVAALPLAGAPAHAAPAVQPDLTRPGAQPKVINGDEVTTNEFAYVVSLLGADRLEQDGAFQAQFCGGALTSPTTVVTAAHCVVDQKTGDVRGPMTVLVGIGSNLRSPNLRIVGVAGITVNPAYARRKATNDVAVLSLTEPVTGIALLRPATPEEATALTGPGAVVRVVGWGNTSTTGKAFPDVLRVGRLVVFPDTSCGGGKQFVYNGIAFNGFPDDEADATVMLCAAGATDAGKVIDSCQGDSGGPLIAETGDSARLVGLVSWGQECASRYPGVYTRISSQYDFLQSAGAIPATPTAPTQPPVLTVAPRDGGLIITITAASDGSTVTAFAATVADPVTGQTQPCFAAPRRTSPSGSCTVTGLVNGTTYAVTAIAGSALGNSPVAGPVTATPAPVPVAGRIVRTSVLDSGRVAFRVTPSEGPDLTADQIVCTPGNGRGQRVADITGPRVVVSGLQAPRYTCLIRTQNAQGTSQSAPVRITPRR